MASNYMTKDAIVGHLANKMGTTKRVAGEFLDEFVKLSYKEAKKSFVIPGLGKLSVSQRKERMGRNPKTGETMLIPAKKVLKFKVTKSAQDAVFPKK